MNNGTFDLAIDLGGTSAKLACYRSGSVEIISNREGVSQTPCAVWLDPLGRLVVGEGAMEALSRDPANVFIEFKRHLGTNKEYTFARNGQRMRPEELSAEVFKSLRADAEQYTGELIRAAVITVPLDFDLSQIEATKRAAALAGFEQPLLLREPVAAALAYGLESKDHKASYLVYDFGGSTFNATVIQIRDGLIQVIGFGGDNQLGGRDIDRAIVEELFIPVLTKDHQLNDFSQNNAKWHGAIGQLTRQAEAAKMRLSFLESTEVLIDFLCSDDRGEPVECGFELRRSELERLATPFIQRTINICKKTMEAARLSPHDIDKVVLVGGTMLFPVLREQLNYGLGLPLESNVDPLTVVARGAAVFAGSSSAGQQSLLVSGEHEPLFTTEIEPEAGAVEPAAVPKASVLPELIDNAQFTVYRPRAAPAGVWASLLAFAHLSERAPDAPQDEPDPIAEVERQATQVLDERASEYTPVRQDSSQSVPRFGEISFVPEMDGFEFNPPQRTFVWAENVHREEFRFRASRELAGQTARGHLTVFLGSIIIAQVALSIRVEKVPTLTHREPIEAVQARAYRKIFASYSHRDSVVVEEFERFASAFGDRYLRDVSHLRAAEVWSSGLEAMIREANIFQLFWSTNSIGSQFVRQEWEYALGLGRANFIRPTYWEDPFPEAPHRGLPPPSLKRLQFSRLPGFATPGFPATTNPSPQSSARAEDIQGSVVPLPDDEKKGHSAPVTSVSVTPDGRRAVSGSVDQTLRVWDLENGQCLRTLAGHSGAVRSVSVRPDGRRAVSGSGDKTLRVWDLESGQCLRVLEGHSDEVTRVSVTPDGRRAVSGSEDNTLRLWEVETGACLAVARPPVPISAVALSPVPGRTIVGTINGEVLQFELRGMTLTPA